ncbi:MAG: aspartate--tRNA(Asn) ligase [Candidatus Brockarchaeota archaeon]|nr:aspartate--tRNA(Asn) ligase [Candidatus Brockarchaeota archaeon]
MRSIGTSGVKQSEGEEVCLAGWVHEKRDLGGIKFLLIRDHLGVVQATWTRDGSNEEAGRLIETLKINDVVLIGGRVRKMKQAPGGIEIVPNSVKILNRSVHPLPLDPTEKVKSGLDTRLNARALDLMTPSNTALFRLEAAILSSCRSFLSENGLVEVVTPKIIATATEGGASLFPIPYFESTAFLAQSPQLYKEQLTLSLGRVYEIATYFRAEPFNTVRHLNEFVSIDVEEAFADAEDVMRLAEGMVKRVHEDISRRCQDELRVLGIEVKVPTTPFERITYAEAVEKIRGLGEEFRSGEDLAGKALESLGKAFGGYYFITEWPVKLRPFYTARSEKDAELSESFDMMYKDLELGSGSKRVSTKDELVQRLRQQGLNPQNFDYHLRVYDYGMPPHAGWAIGFGRLVMAITGAKNIREVTLFPRDRFRLSP